MSKRFGLSIRAASVGDAEPIAELLQTCGLQIASRSLADRLGASVDQPGLVLMAEEWGPPSGLIALHWCWEITADLKVAYATTLMVDPEQRRKGIARLLIKAASQAARLSGCGELRLVAPAASTGIAAFCLATGFEPFGDVFVRPLRKQN